MKRNLKFWTRYTWETLGVDMALMAVLAVLVIFGAEGLNWRLFAATMPYFLCFGAIFGMILINTGAQSLYVPLLLSMGETRRNVLLGFHYYRTLIISVTAALCALIWLLVPGELSSTGLRSIPTLLCVLIAASSFGSILGTILVKWKWLGTILVVLFCGGLGGVLGATGASMAKGLAIADTLDLASYLTRTPWWLILAALASLGLDVAFQGLILRRQEVRL